MRNYKDSPNETYGTTYAAKLLGISVGTVQNLIEKGELPAWKTQGGHRRISLQAIQDYQRRRNLQVSFVADERENRLRVFVVEDDENTRVMLQASFDNWELPLDVTMYAGALEALLDLSTLQPQVLLTDLVMPNVDGFELLKTLNAHNNFQKLTVVAITGISHHDLVEKGGVPKGVQIIQKPIDMTWLHGFFVALTSIKEGG